MNGLRGIVTQAGGGSPAMQAEIDQLQLDVADILLDIAALQSQVNDLPLGEVGFATTTTNTTGMTSTITDLTGLSVAVNVVNGREYKITGQCRFNQSGLNSNPEFYIRIGSTTLNRTTDTVNAGQNRTQICIYRYTAVSTGSVTFKLSASTGLGTLDTLFAADQAGFILVEDMGV